MMADREIFPLIGITRLEQPIQVAVFARDFVPPDDFLDLRSKLCSFLK